MSMSPEVRAAVEAMRTQEGFYMVTDSTKAPMECMIVAVTHGKMFAMLIGDELQPENFYDAASITGPIMPRFKNQ
jgi:hypothetical protein